MVTNRFGSFAASYSLKYLAEIILGYVFSAGNFEKAKQV